VTPGLTLNRLDLTDFRSYASLTWRPAGEAPNGSGIIVITGPNGTGKTNLLEAISMLVPGRGLRQARIADLARLDGTGRWAVSGRFDGPDGPLQIGTGTTGDGPPDRRQFRLDGAAPKNQAHLAARLAAVWLTPQMDRLFQEGASARRRFLDRLVYALEPSHAREVAAYDTAMAGRNRLLAEGRADAAWLAGLEDAMARHAVAATAERAHLVSQLNAALAGGAAAPFPAARLRLLDPIADRLGDEPALAVEDWLRDTLAARRAADAAAGSAGIGAHRADMGLEDAATGLPAALSSTGQQKALLIGVVLGHAITIAQARGFAPLLLLDEPAVHLDRERRAQLFTALESLPAQSIITGTDADLFAPLFATAAGWRTGGRTLQPDQLFQNQTD
jgi:DNA replication and repair protein RecF